MRLYAFDNLRILSIFLVILFHAMCAYTGHAPWWYVHINDQAERYTVFMAITDNFVMSTMFFVSGFFAARSYRKGEKFVDFVASKCKRLLVPGYLNLLLVCPLIYWVITPDNTTLGSIFGLYAENWRVLAQITFENVAPGSMAFHHHLWFVEVLFIISVAFMLLRPLLKPFLRTEDTGFATISVKMFVLLAVSQMITFMTLRWGFDMFQWQSIGGISVLQPTRQGAYISAFAMGLYFFGLYGRVSIKTLATAIFVAFVAFFVVFQWTAVLLRGSYPSLALHAIMANNWTALCFFFLGLTILLCLKFFNKEYRWLRPFYALNYGIYLMHLVFVVVLQKIYTYIDWGYGWEVMTITLGAFLLSAGSTYIKQRIVTHW